MRNFDQWRAGLSIELNTEGLEILTRADMPKLIEAIQQSVFIPSESLVV